MTIGMHLQSAPPEGDVPIAELVPTQHFDIGLMREVADTVGDYASLESEVLLLGGTKGPTFLKVALDALAATLPHAQRVTLTGLDHSGPDDDGDPERVAETLRDFFS
jgi:pimeloyl-ACP methyl ester carboxylesterase